MELNYKLFAQQLREIYSQREAESITRIVFEEITGEKRPQKLTDGQVKQLTAILKELLRHKPVQYALGTADFYGLKLKVNEHVLIPRPETEELAHLIIQEYKKNSAPSIVDIGTGSGCIAIALKVNLPNALVSATDISAGALETARANAQKYRVPVCFLQEDIRNRNSWSAHPLYDVIVSNPPYIPTNEKAQMDKNVSDYEPHTALFTPADNPLLFYKAIADFALLKLKPSGTLYFEAHELKGEEVVSLLRNKGFSDVQLHKDISGKYRIVKAMR